MFEIKLREVLQHTYSTRPFIIEIYKDMKVVYVNKGLDNSHIRFLDLVEYKEKVEVEFLNIYFGEIGLHITGYLPTNNKEHLN